MHAPESWFKALAEMLCLFQIVTGGSPGGFADNGFSVESPAGSGTFSIYAPDSAEPPLTVPLPPKPGNGPQGVPGGILAPENRAEMPAPVKIQPEAPLPAADSGEISQDLRMFLYYELVPEESIYFQPGIGIDAKSGMPYDHLRIRRNEQIVAERGNYTAASKLSLLIPYLLGVITYKTPFIKARLSPPEAEAILRAALSTLHRYVAKYPDYGGFLPWVDIQPNGNIAPSNTKIPSLDNGQLSWALAAVVSALKSSRQQPQKELAQAAEEILASQNYAKFFDPERKMLYGTIQRDFHDGSIWHGDQTYYLNDMCEGTLAVLWAVLNGQIPEDAWYNLKIPTGEYITSAGEKATAILGYRASFHEQWALIFLPFMESELAPLYRNYLYIQADFAREHGLPGFLSTAYDPNGTYRQMGVPDIALQPVDRSDVAVVSATALALLISPALGAEWLKKMYGFGDIRTRFGALESAGKDGYADIMTADGKGLTLLAISGGVVREVRDYLMSHNVPGTKISMYAKFLELVHGKYLQMLEARNSEPLNFPARAYPKPPFRVIRVNSVQRPKDPGPVFDISGHLQPGHLHGKNVRSPGSKTLEDDVKAGGAFELEFEIPAYYPYFDQWAFRGTYISPAVSIAKMKYLALDVPVDGTPMLFEIELKSDDIMLAPVLIDTAEEGVVLRDPKWKTIVKPLQLTPEAPQKHFNYLSVAIHDPRYLQVPYLFYGRRGLIRLRNIRLLREHPFEQAEPTGERTTVNFIPGFDILRYWRMRHGAIPIEYGETENTIFFKGGLGWKGGYLPYIDLAGYKYLYLKIRNLAKNPKDPNRLYVELKNESEYLSGTKIALNMPRGNAVRFFRIELPQNGKPLNYFAISNPQEDFELLAAFLSDDADTKDFDAEVVDVRRSNHPEKYRWYGTAAAVS